MLLDTNAARAHLGLHVPGGHFVRVQGHVLRISANGLIITVHHRYCNIVHEGEGGHVACAASGRENGRILMHSMLRSVLSAVL